MSLENVSYRALSLLQGVSLLQGEFFRDDVILPLTIIIIMTIIDATVTATTVTHHHVSDLLGSANEKYY